MGRNYIAERTLASPQDRALAKRKATAAAKKRAAAEAKFIAVLKERSKWCRAPGCDKPAKAGEDGWWPCCSEDCFHRWNDWLNSAAAKRAKTS